MDKNKLRLAAGIPTKVERPKKITSFRLNEATIRGGRPAPAYASKVDKSVIKAHIDGVKKVIGHLEAAVHELKLIPKTNMGDIAHAIHKIEEIISSDQGQAGLKALLDIYYSDHGDLHEDCDMPPGRFPDTAAPSAIAKYVRYNDQAEEQEEFKVVTPKDLANIPALSNRSYKELENMADLLNTQKDPQIAAMKDDQPMPDNTPDKVKKADGSMDVMPYEQEEYQEESGFSVGQEVKDEGGRVWMVIDTNPVDISEKGKIYAERKKDGITAYLDPASLVVVKEAGGYYTSANALSFDELDKPINVASKTSVDYAPGEDKNEIPHQHLDGDRETTEKVKVPPGVMKALKDGAKEFKDAADKVHGRDQETESLYLTSANAFDQLISYLSDPTIMHIKRAQVYLTSLMGPILHRVPESVVRFLADGGERRSLTKYFYDAKAKK